MVLKHLVGRGPEKHTCLALTAWGKMPGGRGWLLWWVCHLECVPHEMECELHAGLAPPWLWALVLKKGQYMHSEGGCCGAKEAQKMPMLFMMTTFMILQVEAAALNTVIVRFSEWPEWPSLQSPPPPTQPRRLCKKPPSWVRWLGHHHPLPLMTSPYLRPRDTHSDPGQEDK